MRFSEYVTGADDMSIKMFGGECAERDYDISVIDIPTAYSERAV